MRPDGRGTRGGTPWLPPTGRKSAEAAALALAAALFGWGTVLPAVAVPESDFPSYWLAGRLAVQGRLDGRAYDYAWFQREGDAAAALPRTLFSFTPQPPAIALAFAPFGLLDLAPAARAWLAAHAVAAAVAVPALAAAAGVGRVVAAAALIGSGAMLARDLARGPVYLPLLAALAGAAVLAARGRERAAGAVLGVAAALKLLPVLLLFGLALRGRWRAVGPALAAGAAVAGSGLIMLGWDLNAAWLGAVLAGAAGGGFAPMFNPGGESLLSLTLQAFVADPVHNPDPWWHAPRVQAAAWGAARVAVLGAAVWATVSRRAGPGWEPARGLAIWLQAALLVSPILTTYHALLGLFPALVAARALWFRGGAGRGLAAGLAGAWETSAFVYPRHLEAWHGLAGGWTLPFAYLRLWIGLAVLAALVAEAARSGREPAEGGSGVPTRSSGPGRAPRWAGAGLVAAAAVVWTGGAFRAPAGDDPRADGARAEPPDGWDVMSRRGPVAAPGGEVVFSALDWDRYTLHRGAAVAVTLPEHDLFDPAPLSGGALAFTAVRKAGVRDVSVWADGPGGRLRRLSPDALACESPTAADCAVWFTCRRSDLGPARAWRVDACDAGARAAEVPGLGDLFEVAVSPGGERAAIVRAERVGIEVHDLVPGGPATPVATWNDPALRRAERPRFAPDGCRVAFAAWSEGAPRTREESRVRVGDACRGGAPVAVTAGPGRDRDPSFTPDGGTLLFAADGATGVHAYRIHRLGLVGGPAAAGVGP